MSEKENSIIIDNISDEYLKGLMMPEHFFNISDCWFLNSTGINASRSKLRFLKKPVCEKFMVSAYNSSCSPYQNVHGDDTVAGDWSMLLISIFDKRFTLIRENGKTYKLSFCADSDGSRVSVSVSGYDLNRYDEKLSFENVSGTLCAGGKMKLTNNSIHILHYGSVLPGAMGRFCILYMLAKAYVLKLEDFLVREKTDLKKIQTDYESMVNFRMKYIFEVPYCLDRVNETDEIWDEIYRFYKIDILIEEVSSKIKEHYLVSQSRMSQQLNNKLLWLTVVTCILTLLSLFGDEIKQAVYRLILGM